MLQTYAQDVLQFGIPSSGVQGYDDLGIDVAFEATSLNCQKDPQYVDQELPNDGVVPLMISICGTFSSQDQASLLEPAILAAGDAAINYLTCGDGSKSLDGTDTFVFDPDTYQCPEAFSVKCPVDQGETFYMLTSIGGDGETILA